MEQAISEVLTSVVQTFPKAALVYMGLSGCYQIFCAVAAFTPSKEDDKIADKLKRFFSLPVKK